MTAQAKSNKNEVDNNKAPLKDLLLAALSCITYVRGLLPESQFGPAQFGDLAIKSLIRGKIPTPTCFVDMIELGVFDAIDRGYLATLTLAVLESLDRPDASLESYRFSFYYAAPEAVPAGARGHVDVDMSLSNDARPGSLGVLRNGPALAVPIARQVLQFMRTLVVVAQTLHDLPEKVYLDIQLQYNDTTPADYEPPLFRACDYLIQLAQPARLNIQVGDVLVGGHRLSLALATTMSTEIDRFAVGRSRILIGSEPEDEQAMSIKRTSSYPNQSEAPDQSSAPNDQQAVRETSTVSKPAQIEMREGSRKWTLSCPCALTNPTAALVQCDKCRAWAHISCHGFRQPTDAALRDRFLCHACNPTAARVADEPALQRLARLRTAIATMWNEYPEDEDAATMRAKRSGVYGKIPASADNKPRHVWSRKQLATRLGLSQPEALAIIYNLVDLMILRFAKGDPRQQRGRRQPNRSPPFSVYVYKENEQAVRNVYALFAPRTYQIPSTILEQMDGSSQHLPSLPSSVDPVLESWPSSTIHKPSLGLFGSQPQTAYVLGANNDDDDEGGGSTVGTVIPATPQPPPPPPGGMGHSLPLVTRALERTSVTHAPVVSAVGTTHRLDTAQSRDLLPTMVPFPVPEKAWLAPESYVPSSQDSEPDAIVPGSTASCLLLPQALPLPLPPGGRRTAATRRDSHGFTAMAATITSDGGGNGDWLPMETQPLTDSRLALSRAPATFKSKEMAVLSPPVFASPPPPMRGMGPVAMTPGSGTTTEDDDDEGDVDLGRVLVTGGGGPRKRNAAAVLYDGESVDALSVIAPTTKTSSSSKRAKLSVTKDPVPAVL